MPFLKKVIPALIIILIISSSCSKQGVGKLFTEKAPYKKYVDKLDKADLLKTALGKDWVEAGENALRDSISIEIPFREVGYFSEKQIRALSYSITARRGEVISVKAHWQPRENGELFIDFFEKDRAEEPLISVDSTLSFSYEVGDDDQYLLRLQPELLRGGKYILEVTSRPSLAFPIPAQDARAIGSFFGVDRDGGKRKHEGVDIFVPKRTPVVAIASGRITRVGENRLGGKVVFLNDFDKRQTYYYAHLDEQLVSAGEKVEIGDTLGLVGNTGNAKYTPSHLHFSIYSWNGGAIDPLPFLGLPKEKTQEFQGSEKLLDTIGSIKGRKVFLYNEVSVKPVSTDLLRENSIVRLIGGNGKFYRIELPDGRQGYVKTKQVQALKKIKTLAVEKPLPLLEVPENYAAVLDSIPMKSKYSVLGQYKDFLFVEHKEQQGWILKDLLN